MLFDVILRTQSILIDWLVVLFQLLLSGIITPNQSSDYTMFTDVTDMVVILMQMMQLNDNQQNSNPTSNNGVNSEVFKYSAIVRKLRVSHKNYMYLHAKDSFQLKSLNAKVAII